jgi:hypothetical protein
VRSVCSSGIDEIDEDEKLEAPSEREKSVILGYEDPQHAMIPCFCSNIMQHQFLSFDVFTTPFEDEEGATASFGLVILEGQRKML